MNEEEQLQESANKSKGQLDADVLQGDETEISIPELGSDSSTVDDIYNLTAGVTSKLKELLKTYKTEEPEEQKNLRQRMLGMITGRKSATEVTAEQEAEFGIEEKSAEVESLTVEAVELKKRLDNLEAEELQATEALYGQGRGIPMAILTSQAKAINREYTIRKMGVAADLSAKAALIEAKEGRLESAEKLADKAIDAYLYDQRQELEDLKTVYGMNQDIIDNMSKDQKDLLTTQISFLENQLEDKKKEKAEVRNLMLKYADAGISLDDTPDSATKKASNWVQAHPEDKSSLATTGIVELTTSVMQDAIDKGLSADEAVALAIGYARNLGQDVSNEDLVALNAKAKSITPTLVAPEPKAAPKTAVEVGRGVGETISPYYQTFSPSNLGTGVKTVGKAVGGFFKGLFGG